MLTGNKIIFKNTYRSIGITEAERYGIGFMDKSGMKLDTGGGSYPSYVMVLVLQGNGTYTDCSGNSYSLKPGCCFQRFPNIPHTTILDPSSHWQECFIELGHSLWSFLQKTLAVNLSHPVLEVPLTPGLIDRFSKLQQKFLTVSDIDLVHCLPDILDLAQLLHTGGLPEHDFAHRRLLSKACEYLSEDFSQPVDFHDFCRRNGCGYENFRKKFKEELGISPHHYRIRRRLDEACALLSDADLTIAEISQRLGYSSPYEFSAQFKEYMGYPPKTYKFRR